MYLHILQTEALREEYYKSFRKQVGMRRGPNSHAMNLFICLLLRGVAYNVIQKHTHVYLTTTL
jgi:hypothetical protein